VIKNKQRGTGAVVFYRKGDRLRFVRKDLNGDPAGNPGASRHRKCTVSWLDFWMIGFFEQSKVKKESSLLIVLNHPFTDFKVILIAAL